MRKQKKLHIDERTQVIRVSVEAYRKLKAIAAEQAKEAGTRVHLTNVFDKVFETIDQLAASKPYYLVGSRAFTDLADARGEAVMNAAIQDTEVQAPLVCVLLGKDEGR